MVQLWQAVWLESIVFRGDYDLIQVQRIVVFEFRVHAHGWGLTRSMNLGGERKITVQ